MMTQTDIDRPDFYVFPALRWESFLTMKNRFYPRIKQGEFLPNDQIIIALRRMAEKQGKPVEIVEATDKPRWAKTIAKWTLIIVALSFLIGMLTSVGRADEINVGGVWFTVTKKDAGKDQYLLIENKNVRLKVYPCGRVTKEVWKEINPNEEDTSSAYTISSPIIWSNGTATRVIR
jgi:hypothetical protein